jgi:hypothetical protein
MPGRGRARKALPQHVERIDDVSHGPTVRDGAPDGSGPRQRTGSPL